MKKTTTLVMLLLVICSPLTASGYSKWGIFAHRNKYELEDVLKADKFVEKKGYWEGYRGSELVGYAFLSTEWTKNLLGYSGQHLETLIGMDRKGVLTGVKVIFHSEPIVLIGLKDSNYQEFIKQYSGKNVTEELAIGKDISIDAITGATVTAVVQNAIIIRSARKVASLVGLIETQKRPRRKISDTMITLSWEELLNAKAVKKLAITTKDLGLEGEETYLDLYFGLLSVPSIGKNVLGAKRYKETVGRLGGGEAFFGIFAKGKGSFKGSGYARGGIFDRFNLTQEERIYVFRETDYKILTDIKAKGAPAIQEGGLFVVREKDFDPAGPFKFNLVVPYRVRGRKDFKSFSIEYKTPDMFLE